MTAQTFLNTFLLPIQKEDFTLKQAKDIIAKHEKLQGKWFVFFFKLK